MWFMDSDLLTMTRRFDSLVSTQRIYSLIRMTCRVQLLDFDSSSTPRRWFLLVNSDSPLLAIMPRPVWCKPYRKVVCISFGGYVLPEIRASLASRLRFSQSIVPIVVFSLPHIYRTLEENYFCWTVFQHKHKMYCPSQAMASRQVCNGFLSEQSWGWVLPGYRFTSLILEHCIERYSRSTCHFDRLRSTMREIRHFTKYSSQFVMYASQHVNNKQSCSNH